MSCLNPNLLRCFIDEYTGLVSYNFLGNARYKDAKNFGKFSDIIDGKDFFVTIPCRHCLGCAIDYSREWANRMCLELQECKKAVFVTLTYNDAHLPKIDSGKSTLCVRDTQLFFKRLRKRFDFPIRYYLVGEYGTHFTKRPHYHAILFGLGLNDFPDLRFHKITERGDILYISDIFASIWQNGFCDLAEVNYKTCAYVARYTLKKHYGFNKRELEGALPEFNTCSRRPGIGLNSYQSILSRDSDIITINTGDDVHTFPIPKAIIKKGLKDDKFVDICNDLRYTKLDKSNDRIISDLIWSEKTYDQYLRDNHKELYKKIKLLKERR